MIPSWLEGAAAVAAADAEGRAPTAAGVCWTVPGWAPGTVLSVVAAPLADVPLQPPVPATSPGPADPSVQLKEASTLWPWV